MPANATRGESALTLDGQRFVLRPSFAALNAIEAKTGRSLVELALMAGQGRMSIGAMATIATECIRAWGTANPGDEGKVAASVNEDRIAECIFEADGGVMVAMKTIEIVLMLGVTGGLTASGERKPPRDEAPKKKATRGGA